MHLFKTMLQLLSFVIFVAAAGLQPAHALIASNFSTPLLGKLWIVPLDTSPGAPHPGGLSGVDAVFPVPEATPDLTFSTSLIDYADNVGGFYTIASFLDGKVSGVTFSGLNNAALGGVASSATKLWSEGEEGNWGTFIELSGPVFLSTSDHIRIAHDDGVSVKLNEELLACYASPDTTHYTAADGAENCFYTGPSEVVQFDLVYTEGYGGNALLQVEIPEPGTLALLAASLLGLVGATKLRRR